MKPRSWDEGAYDPERLNGYSAGGVRISFCRRRDIV